MRSAARAALLALAVLLPLAPATAGASPMGRDEARLLLTRTSFAASQDEVDGFAALSRSAAVDRLLSWVEPEPSVSPPAWTAAYERPSRESLATPEGREAYRREQQRRAFELRAWWLAEMLTTPSPLTEKMTLFWHNHFVSAQPKVRIAHLMYAQNALFRRHALGNFRTLLHAVARDPAMLIYLDAAGSRSEAPNENFAREVMELFTLGEGHYTEADVKQAARAITGWTVDREAGTAVFRPRFHDRGDKTIFNLTRRFDMDGVLDLLLTRPETARFVVAKLWKEFVSPAPDAPEVERLAAIFREADYELRPLLRALLASDAFYAEANRAMLVKSPVDLVVGTLREFRFQVNEPGPFVNALRQLGQELFNPPNVRGWPGGEAWIHSSSLLARKQLLERLFRFEAGARDTAMRPVPLADAGVIAAPRAARVRNAMNGSLEFDSERWLGVYTALPDGGIRMTEALLPTAPVRANVTQASLAAIREIVLDPAYQLK